MNETDLLERLLAEPLPELPQQLVPAALVDGRRRVRRRRGLAATAVALLGTGALALPHSHHRAVTPPTSLVPRVPLLTAPAQGDEVDAYLPLLTTPTRGDRAGDRAFLDAATKAWSTWVAGAGPGDASEQFPFHHLVGTPHVAWAGSTPAGPAAVIAQPGQSTFPGAHASPVNGPFGDYVAVGFIGVGADGRPVVVAGRTTDNDSIESTAWPVDSAKRTLVVLDTGEGTGISTHLSYDHDGTARRVYSQDLDWQDGAAVVTLPKGVPSYAVVVGPFRYQEGAVGNRPVASAVPDPCVDAYNAKQLKSLAELTTCEKAHDGTLHWFGAPHVGGGGSRSLEDVAEAWRRATEGLVAEPFSTSGDPWFADGVVPDGRRVTVGERIVEQDPDRLLLVIEQEGHPPITLDEGVVDGTAVLPVRVHLPDGQGWVVAQDKATLRWRSGSGTWSAPTADAALVPDATTEVEVTRPGQVPVVVKL